MSNGAQVIQFPETGLSEVFRILDALRRPRPLARENKFAIIVSEDPAVCVEAMEAYLQIRDRMNGGQPRALRVTVPASPTSRILHKQVLVSSGGTPGKAADFVQDVQELRVSNNADLLVLEDAHRVIGLNGRIDWETLGFVRGLLDENVIPVVLLGSPALLRITMEDQQMARRCCGTLVVGRQPGTKRIVQNSLDPYIASVS